MTSPNLTVSSWLDPNFRHRKHMEDAISTTTRGDRQVFGVYDGHGGADTVELLEAHFTGDLAEMKELSKRSLTKAFVSFNDYVRQECMDSSGACAAVVIFEGNLMYTANVGDTRAVLVSGCQVTRLSVDHTPEDRREYERLDPRYLTSEDRLRGPRGSDLAVSRAFGDFTFVQSGLIAIPHVDIRPVIRGSYVVLATDGFWDVVEEWELPKLLRKYDAKGLVKLSLRRGTEDNVAVTVVRVN